MILIQVLSAWVVIVVAVVGTDILTAYLAERKVKPRVRLVIPPLPPEPKRPMAVSEVHRIEPIELALIRADKFIKRPGHQGEHRRVA